MSNELTVVNPGALMTQATDVAGVCKEIVMTTAMTIQGRKYVKVEGWQSIAAAYGCVASSKNVQKVDGGISATGEVHRISDGALIATAEGFVGEDEATWFGGTVMSYGKEKVLPKRPDYAIRAMAQTRAISRVCRSAFAFVVVMIDSKLSTTPAEEMMGIHDAPEEKVIAKAPEMADVLNAIAKMRTKPERDAAKALADRLTDEPQIKMAEAAWDAKIKELKGGVTVVAGGEV